MTTTHLIILLTTFAFSPAAHAGKRVVPFRTAPGEPFTGKMARQDYATYAHIRDTPTCWTYRFILKAIPYTRTRAFWGNYAGSGCASGRPKDEMDEIFRRHDVAYDEARSLRTMQWADAACVEALRKLDTRKMSPTAIAFRDRSASFFSSRALTLVGKPVSSYLIARESKDCPFQCEADVRELFGLEKAPAATPAARRHTKPQAATQLLTSAKPASRSHETSATRKPPVTFGTLLAGNGNTGRR